MRRTTVSVGWVFALVAIGLLGAAPVFGQTSTAIALGDALVASRSNSAPTIVAALPVTCPSWGTVLISGSGESKGISTNAGPAFIGLAYSIARDSLVTDNGNVVQSSALAWFVGDTNRDVLNIQRVDLCTPAQKYTYRLTVYRTTLDTSPASAVVNGRLTAGVPYSSPGIGLAPGSTVIASTSNAAPTIVTTLAITCPASGRLLLAGAGESTALSTNPGSAFIGVAYSIAKDSMATHNASVVQSSALGRFNGDANRDFLSVQRADDCTPGMTSTYRLTAYRTTPDTGPGSFVWNGSLVASEPLSSPAAGYAPGMTSVGAITATMPTVVAGLSVTCPASGAVWLIGSGESAALSNGPDGAFMGLTYSIARDSPVSDPTTEVQTSANGIFNGDANRDFLNVQRAESCPPGVTSTYYLTAYRSTPATAATSFVWNGRLVAVALRAAPQSPANGNYLWLRTVGNAAGTVAGYSTAVDAAGNRYVAGEFWGSADFVGLTLVSHGSADAFVAKFSPSGDLLWAKHFGSFLDDRAMAVETDSAGNVIVAGSFTGSVSFGGAPLTAAGAGTNSDIFVAKFSPTGAHIWSQRFGGAGNDAAAGVALDAAGNVVVTGSFEGRAMFGAAILSSAGNSQDVFLIKLAADGTMAWTKAFGGTLIDAGNGVAMDAIGNIFVSGSFMGTVDFGGGAVTSAGAADGFFAKFSPAGAHLWSKRVGGTGDDSVYGIAVDAGGNVAVTGYVQNGVDFGGGPTVGRGQLDAFVAVYSAADGAHAWSRRMGGAQIDEGFGVAIDGTGNVLVAGSFRGTVDFGMGPQTAIGETDIFAAKYGPGGTPLWAKALGGSGYDSGYAVSIDGYGAALVAGAFQGAVDFGGGTMTAAGQLDMFLLNLAP